MAGFRLSFQAPVDVLARDRRIPDGPVVEGPEVGLCWGKASDFEWGLPPETAPNETPAILIRQVEDVLFKGVESYREFSEEFPIALPAEGIANATFYLGPRVEETEERRISGTTTVIQPIVTTVHEYIEFAFDLVTEGTRGETPPAQDEPPRRSAKIVPAIDMSSFRTIVRLDTTDDDLVRWRVQFTENRLNSSPFAGPVRSTEAEAIADGDAWVAGYAGSGTAPFYHVEVITGTLGGTTWRAWYFDRAFREFAVWQADDWIPPAFSDLDAYRALSATAAEELADTEIWSVASGQTETTDPEIYNVETI